MSHSDDTTKQDIIDKAIDLATTGDPSEAIRLLWPVMLDGTQRDQALFALAFCFEKAQNYATGYYLYTKTLEGYPSFTAAAVRQQACRRVVQDQGLIEDFEDMGHRECTICTLRYRSEFSLCPYCGSEKDEKAPARKEKKPDAQEKEPLPGWEDSSIFETLQDMGRDAADRIQDIVESDAVKKISER